MPYATRCPPEVDSTYDLLTSSASLVVMVLRPSLRAWGILPAPACRKLQRA